MERDDLRIAEIVSLDDALLPPWLALYETSFPPTERVLVASFLAKLREGGCGPSQDYHLLAVVDATDTLVGLACYEMTRGAAVACLWYLAVLPELRNRGIGSWCYRQMVARAQGAGAQAATIEVEIPEEAHSEAEREFARRRIGFYQRLGARLLTGIRYTQSVGSHQPPIPMHLMIHAFGPITARGAFDLAQGVFGESLVPAGEPALC